MSRGRIEGSNTISFIPRQAIPKGEVVTYGRFVYDSNAILAQPIKYRTAPELLRSFQVMEQELVARGLRPKLMKVDNEASKLLEMYLHQQNITFQLVPPYSHRRNSAERAIRSFKDHLIAGICSTDKSFPMHLWDRLLPQAVITLNMLRIMSFICASVINHDITKVMGH
jgi:hypothetical protein